MTTRFDHIFMDHQSTTPVDLHVVDRMMPYFSEIFGNPASRHPEGEAASKAIDLAREQAGALIGAPAKTITFTSGATESINIALRGIAGFYEGRNPHFITSVTEHPAVLKTCQHLETRGVKVTYLGVDPQGRISLDELREAVTIDTVLISIMYANNEIGTLQDVKRIGEVAREHNILYHCDASQAAGLEPIDVEEMYIDLLSLTAHKIYGPKGAGLLYHRHRRPRVRLEPCLFGGEHENGLRPGTMNVPAIVGLGAACEFAASGRVELNAHLTQLRDRLYEQLRRRMPDIRLNGHPKKRHPGNLNVTFLGVDARELLAVLPNVSLSAGSACASAIPRPSYVLMALGLSERMARGSVRFGLGRANSEAQVDRVIDLVCKAVNKLRASR